MSASWLSTSYWQVYQELGNVWKRTINVAKSLKFLWSRKVHLNFISEFCSGSCCSLLLYIAASAAYSACQQFLIHGPPKQFLVIIPNAPSHSQKVWSWSGSGAFSGAGRTERRICTVSQSWATMRPNINIHTNDTIKTMTTTRWWHKQLWHLTMQLVERLPRTKSETECAVGRPVEQESRKSTEILSVPHLIRGLHLFEDRGREMGRIVIITPMPRTPYPTAYLPVQECLVEWIRVLMQCTTRI